jgi:hypothetical protein
MPGNPISPLSGRLVASWDHTDQSTANTAATPAIQTTAAMARNGQRTGGRVPKFAVEAIMKAYPHVWQRVADTRRLDEINYGAKYIKRNAMITIPGVLTWRWVPEYLIRRPPTSTTRIQIRAIAAEKSYAVRANPILGGLHHEYSLVPAAA